MLMWDLKHSSAQPGDVLSPLDHRIPQFARLTYKQGNLFAQPLTLITRICDSAGPL